MNRKIKQRETFVIKILGQENATWQGSITWAEGNKVQHFRSALELLKMMDAVIEDDEEGGEEHDT